MQGSIQSLSFLAVAWLVTGGVLANEQTPVLPATCHAIANHSDALCIVETPSPDMPVNDVVFYRKDASERFVFLEATKLPEYSDVNQCHIHYSIFN